MRGGRHSAFGPGKVVSPVGVNLPVNQVAMNHSETLQQRLARLTAEADAFLEAGYRSREAAALACRELGVKLQNPLSHGCEDLTLEERLVCEAFVMAHIRHHTPQSRASGSNEAAWAPAGHAQAKSPAPLDPVGTRFRQGGSRAHQMI